MRVGIDLKIFDILAANEKPVKLRDLVVLEGLPPVLEHAIPHDKIEVQVQDFFQPQAVKGGLCQ